MASLSATASAQLPEGGLKQACEPDLLGRSGKNIVSFSFFRWAFRTPITFLQMTPWPCHWELLAFLDNGAVRLRSGPLSALSGRVDHF